MKYVTGFPVCCNSMARKLFDKNGKIWKHTRINVRANREKGAAEGTCFTLQTQLNRFMSLERLPEWSPPDTNILNLPAGYNKRFVSDVLLFRKEAKEKWEGSGGIQMLCRWSRCVRYLAAKSYVQVLREPGHDVRAEEQGDGRQKVSALDALG